MTGLRSTELPASLTGRIWFFWNLGTDTHRTTTSRFLCRSPPSSFGVDVRRWTRYEPHLLHQRPPIAESSNTFVCDIGGTRAVPRMTSGGAIPTPSPARLPAVLAIDDHGPMLEVLHCGLICTDFRPLSPYPGSSHLQRSCQRNVVATSARGNRRNLLFQNVFKTVSNRADNEHPAATARDCHRFGRDHPQPRMRSACCAAWSSRSVTRG